MAGWGDEWDPEVVNRRDPVGRVTLNFKKIWVDVDAIVDGTANVDEKHPKNELMKEWTGAMIAFFIIFLLSYKYFAFFTVPFTAFYIISLVKIFQAWKHFKYMLAPIILGTIGMVIGMLAAALVIQHFYPF